MNLKVVCLVVVLATIFQGSLGVSQWSLFKESFKAGYEAGQNIPKNIHDNKMTSSDAMKQFHKELDAKLQPVLEQHQEDQLNELENLMKPQTFFKSFASYFWLPNYFRKLHHMLKTWAIKMHGEEEIKKHIAETREEIRARKAKRANLTNPATPVSSSAASSDSADVQEMLRQTSFTSDTPASQTKPQSTSKQVSSSTSDTYSAQEGLHQA